MIFENNPIMRETHAFRRQQILSVFHHINLSQDANCLSLYNYVEGTPEKYFCKKAYATYFQFLEQVKTDDSTWLVEILNESADLMSLANQVMADLNARPIHDVRVGRDHALREFVDSEIHYSLLKLYEVPYYQFMLIVARYSRVKRGAKADRMDLYNVVEEIKRGSFDFAAEVYSSTIRNSISHGKIRYTDLNTLYIDKSSTEEIPTGEIVKIFDKLLDVVNGFCLAMKMFFLSNVEYIAVKGIATPRSFLLEELQAMTNGPAWKVFSCIESTAIGGKHQLNISVRNDFWDYSKVQWNSFFTAYWTERLTRMYDRIFIHLHSAHSMNGWAAFNANQLRSIREGGDNRLEQYRGVLEENLLFFRAYLRFPRFIYKLGGLRMAYKVHLPLAWNRFREMHFPKLFTVRTFNMHSKGRYAAVVDPSIVAHPGGTLTIEDLVRTKYQAIIRAAIKAARKECSRFSILRYLPVRYIRVFVYDTDKRIRHFGGLTPDLVATIEVNTSGRIKPIDIFNSTIEMRGKYRIAWHNNWRGRREGDFQSDSNVLRK